MTTAQCSGRPPHRKAGARALVAALGLAALVGWAPPARAQQGVLGPVPAELLARAAALDPGERLGALASLQALGTPAAYDLVLVLLQRDLDPRVRAAAAVALGASHDPSFDGPLGYAAAADGDPAVRAAAASARALVAPFKRRPRVAAGFSMLCPGCGYFYLGQHGRAVGYLAGVAALFATGLAVLDASPLVTDGTTVTHDPGRATPFLAAAQNLWFYGVFASYRDARLARGDLGARFPVARETLPELLAAPFHPRVLKRPWVWAGVPLMLGAGVAASYLISRATSQPFSEGTRTLGDPGGVQFFGERYGTATGFALGSAYNVGMFLPVGVGEEALFRGVVQAGLSETSLGLWGGWAVGSAIFGAIHTFNFIGDANGLQTAALAVPYLIVTGSYLGYVFIKTDFSLLAGTAIHFWYDFGLSTIAFVADPDHQPFVMRFGVPF